MENQCQDIAKYIYFQENQSAIFLETKGRSSVGERSRNISVHYSFISALLTKGEVKVQHCGTDSMVAKFLTNILQSSNVIRFQKLIIGTE